MKVKRECVAMLLAGGQGSRLYVLTENIAKPAVPFGGKYRIIDFPLSNCINSGIDTVGVLTQYRPHALNEYVGNGQPWDLDRLSGGVCTLPPYQRGKTSEWYKGTANAIYQNIDFVDTYNPEYVLILSGDHIYKMNYAKMLKKHKETDADATIAVLEVPIDEASRFGIMNCGENGEIYEFEEKPENPKSNLASMGIYIFKWDKLKQYLIDDENSEDTENDFGKNIIPIMIKNNEKLYSYRFNGYWKDVGTIESLWEANMDLLSTESGLRLDDDGWKIYARNTGSAPHFCSGTSKVRHSLISEGCEIYGEVEESVLFSDVLVEEGASVRYSIVMPGAVIREGAVVQYSIIAENAVIGSGAKVGGAPTEAKVEKWGVAVVASNVNIGKNVVVNAGEMPDKDINDRG